ncbi:nicotinate-nucleotide pyrophosphorylase [Thiohalorhabdus denitrificans]|uniref:Probable nicotinate-nucleotide pyrophosphorylase [carboxylating] n=1 Tax=Thiohalorhabdus denitrificans TaxID=381306 RepID=A0A0P9CBY5_9GAMM|nr:carboxylating nicotinate-nucleotide diphosphorylase [Thiohalorhabdus denitrificans]KPV40448.1 nicotinate-nucleotide pyrophosphorylase [Thiohalorhabdus denitrificans]SCY61076.1 nicotinate-nucleotide pyrophosphorylase [carboxylating] [Thiohalorhabdus denitrificans]
MSTIPLPLAGVQETVARALAEDIGPGDLSLAAVPADRDAEAVIVAREKGILCGRPFVEEAFHQLDSRIAIRWHAGEGERLEVDAEVASLRGPARPLLTGERTALNFLQTLSGTATATTEMVEAVAGTGVRIVDTRKTLPGLRGAQKYAVRVGGGHNHRHGLFDGVLLKENHLAWAGGLEPAVRAAREAAPHTVGIQVEVEDLEEFRTALAAGVDAVLLDNFSLDDLNRAVSNNNGGCFLEASGNIDLANVREVAETGVHAISSGALTRDLTSLDLSMRFRDRPNGG